MRNHLKQKLIYTVVVCVVIYLLFSQEKHYSPDPDSFPDYSERRRQISNYDAMGLEKEPFIFIGGMPGSGTTLLRVIMDVHPDVRCGDETKLIPYLLTMRWEKWEKPRNEKFKLMTVGVTDQVIDSAMRAFISAIIKGSGEDAKRLCNKDPFVLKDADYLSQIFPESKFILLLRDGRAVCHSIISRGITIGGYNYTNYRDCLIRWSQNVEYLYVKCLQVGKSKCIPVRYEQLVQYPEESVRRILKFLELPWNEAVLKHSTYVVNDEVNFASNDKKTKQLRSPINTNSLSSWVDHIPEDVKQEMPIIAPSLREFGYDPKANPPLYSFDNLL